MRGPFASDVCTPGISSDCFYAPLPLAFASARISLVALRFSSWLRVRSARARVYTRLYASARDLIYHGDRSDSREIAFSRVHA